MAPSQTSEDDYLAMQMADLGAARADELRTNDDIRRPTVNGPVLRVGRSTDQWIARWSMLIDDNASDAVEDQDIAGGQLHRMNQRSARGGRGSGAGRGGGVGGSRSRQEYISSHQSSRFGMSGDARQASLNPPPVRTFQPTVAIYPPVDESRSRAHLTPVQGGLDRRTPRQQVPESSVRPVQRQQVPESSVRPVQRQHQLPHVVEEPVPSNTHKAIVSRTRERLTRLSVSVSNYTIDSEDAARETFIRATNIGRRETSHTTPSVTSEALGQYRAEASAGPSVAPETRPTLNKPDERGTTEPLLASTAGNNPDIQSPVGVEIDAEMLDSPRPQLEGDLLSGSVEDVNDMSRSWTDDLAGLKFEDQPSEPDQPTEQHDVELELMERLFTSLEAKFRKNPKDAKASQALLTIRARLDELELPETQPTSPITATTLNEPEEHTGTLANMTNSHHFIKQQRLGDRPMSIATNLNEPAIRTRTPANMTKDRHVIEPRGLVDRPMSTTHVTDDTDRPLFGDHNLPHRWDSRRASQPDVGATLEAHTASSDSHGPQPGSGRNSRNKPLPRYELPAFIKEWEKESKEREDRGK